MCAIQLNTLVAFSDKLLMNSDEYRRSHDGRTRMTVRQNKGWSGIAVSGGATAAVEGTKKKAKWKPRTGHLQAWTGTGRKPACANARGEILHSHVANRQRNAGRESDRGQAAVPSQRRNPRDLAGMGLLLGFDVNFGENLLLPRHPCYQEGSDAIMYHRHHHKVPTFDQLAL
jgi:hypothetical protein